MKTYIKLVTNQIYNFGNVNYLSTIPGALTLHLCPKGTHFSVSDQVRDFQETSKTKLLKSFQAKRTRKY